ncbi:MAG: M23 family metallopeptidase [Chloroflexi bacterium]|nr:M23 family metallopeptidase [Chloroflexota bacterium]
MQLFRLAPLLLLWLTLAGCGAFSSASPTPTPTATPSPTPTMTPTSTPTPTPAPELIAATIQIPQGAVGVLEFNGGAASAVAAFDGRDYALLAREGGFWGVIGVGADKPLGVYPVTIMLLDAAGGVLTRLGVSVEVVDTAYPVEAITFAPDQSALLTAALSEQEAATRAVIYSRHTPEQLWEGVFLQPLPGPISSQYGIGRSYNGGPVTSFHHGTDFALDEGTPVVAANSGRVAFSGDLPIRGLSVILDHGGGVFTAYHHLSVASVLEDQFVSIGDLVGLVGASGLATGPHLHWELVVGGVEVDPMLWTVGAVGPRG